MAQADHPNTLISHDEWELMGERIELTPEALAQLMARQNAIHPFRVNTINLSSFVQGVRQI